MAHEFLLPTGPGELLDRLSILLIKHSAMGVSVAKREQTREVINRILGKIGQGTMSGRANAAVLLDTCSMLASGKPDAFRGELQFRALYLSGINQQLWHIEDHKRACDDRKDFGAFFVDLSRKVHLLNDERAVVKAAIDKLLGYAGEPKHYSSE